MVDTDTQLTIVSNYHEHPSNDREMCSIVMLLIGVDVLGERKSFKTEDIGRSVHLKIVSHPP